MGHLGDGLEGDPRRRWVGGRFAQRDRRAVGPGAVERRRIGEVDRLPRVAGRAVDLVDQPVGAAVGVVPEHDAVGRPELAQYRVLGRHAGGERERVAPALERGQARLQRVAGGVAAAAVLPASVLADGPLGERGGHADRGDDGTARRVGRLPGVDGAGVEPEVVPPAARLGWTAIARLAHVPACDRWLSTSLRLSTTWGRPPANTTNAAARSRSSTARASGWPMPMVGSRGPITFSTCSSITVGSRKARSIRLSSSTAPRISAAASGIVPLATGTCDTP